jgi:hypothetical protein
MRHPASSTAMPHNVQYGTGIPALLVLLEVIVHHLSAWRILVQ